MKVSQADTINMLYRNYNDTINDLKQSIQKEKIRFYDTIIKKIHSQPDSVLYWKGQLEKSKIISIPIRGEDRKGEEKVIPIFLLIIATILTINNHF